MTCPGVTVPPLADQDITKLHTAWSDQRQQCSMAPSVKQEMHQTVTMPLSIKHESYHITPPFMKQELHPTMKMPFVRRQQTRHVTSPCIKREDPLPDNLDLDDSLTSLNWLHDIKMMKIGQPTPPSSPTPLSYANRQTENLPTYIQKQQLILMNESCGLDSQSDIFRTQCLQDSIDYRENGWVKPPYSYATLIWMAMKDSQKSKITLSAIYKWITDNFKYYRTAEPSWQNSIRHNLSLNKCFQKVPRGKDEPGKGGFWRIDPVHAELLESGIWKKRRALSLLEMEYEPMKRIRMSSLDQPSELSLDPPLVLDVPQYLPQSESDGEVFEIEVKPKVSKPKRHKSKSKKRSKSKRPKSSKQARESFPKEDSSTSEDDNLPSSVLNGTFQWESIFDSEIEIDGVRVRAEAILNPNGEVQLLPIVDSPPHSEENEEFSLFLDEDPLDLSIKGTHIPKPLWFESQIQSRLEETEAEQTVLNESTEDLFGMRDLPPSPASSLDDQMTHPWAESRDPVEDIYFEEFLNLEDSGHLVGVSGTWAPDHAIQTIVIENDK